MDGMGLKLRRVQAGLTLWELGRLADVHPARISEMERGQRDINPAVVAALDEMLRVEPEMAGAED